MFRLMILGLALVLAGCRGEPTIDASSASEFRESTEVVKQSLPEGDRELFEQSFETLMMQGVNPLTVGLEIAANPGGELPESIVDQFDGKTGREIIEAARPALEEQRSEDERRYRRLLKRRDEMRAASEMLAAIEFHDFTFKSTDGPLTSQATFTGRITNGASEPVHRVTVEVQMVSADRSAPWMEFDLLETIPGGVEPGETREVEFDALAFEGWRSDIALPDNVEVKMTAVDFTTPDGVRIFATDLGPFARRELELLERKFGDS